MNWIISADTNVYDVSNSFKDFGFIDWKQGDKKYEVEDIVYIYCIKPLQMIQYKCRAEIIGLNSNQIRKDKDYYSNEDDFYDSLKGSFMRLVLIEQVFNNNLGLDQLLQHGLKSAPRGPMKVKEGLLEYIEKYFTDDYQSDIYLDGLNKIEIEGAKKTILINKYERSPKARENAIKYHGLNCKVCNVNFEGLYGEIGKDFIHIHHLVPIHEIGEDYKINYQTDLIPICPNCHSIIHKRINGVEPTVDELKMMLKKNKNTPE